MGARKRAVRRLGRSACLLAAACFALLATAALMRSDAGRSLVEVNGGFIDPQASAVWEHPVAAAASAAASFEATPGGTTNSLAVPSSSSGSGLRLLFVGHELSLTGAPLALFELALRMRERGHTIRFVARLGRAAAAAAAPTLTRHAVTLPVQLHVDPWRPAGGGNAARRRGVDTHHRHLGHHPRHGAQAGAATGCCPKGCSC